jgi:hypothetical protein
MGHPERVAAGGVGPGGVDGTAAGARHGVEHDDLARHGPLRGIAHHAAGDTNVLRAGARRDGEQGHEQRERVTA